MAHLSVMGAHSTATVFCSWMESMHIIYNTQAIKVIGSQPGAMLIEAVSDVDQGETLASIPKEACITVYTTELTDILAEEELAGGLGLVIAVWYEKGLGKLSKWSGYLMSMREREYLPIFWSEEELKQLQGTEVSGCTDSDRRDIEEDYEQHVVPLMQKYPEAFKNVSDTSLEAFKNAASLVASRAFAVDEEHGDGMVPLADVFNHKVSIVKLSDDYAIHGAEDTSSDSSYHSGEEEGGGEEEEEHDHDDDDSTAGLQHLPCPQEDEDFTMCGMKQANQLPLRLHIAIIDDTENDSLKIIAASPIERGKEIFNTYGELGNAELVKKYGFCVPENPFTFVSLDKSCVFSAVENLVKRTAKRRKIQGKNVYGSIQQILVEQTMLADESDDEPFHLHPNGYISVSILVYLITMIHGLCGVDVDPVEEFLATHATEALNNPEPVSMSWALSHIESSLVKQHHIADSLVSDMTQNLTDALIEATERRLMGYGQAEMNSVQEAAKILRDSEITILKDFLAAIKRE